MNQLTYPELADMQLAYGAAHGNAVLARQLYGERYPERFLPDRRAFVNFDRTLRENGAFQVIFGPMFSGKTTELIRRLKRYQVAKYKCLIVRYANDDRYSTVGISTHDKQQLPAVSARQLNDLKEIASDNCVIGIDEGQFFPDCVPFAEEMANRGKIVIVAALDGTFQRVGFGNILNLVPLAESVVKLKAVCHTCFKDAAFTKRTSQDMQLELIGGDDLYMAVCRDCHLSGFSQTNNRSNSLQPLSEISENVRPAHREKVLSIGADKYQQRMAFDVEF